MLIWLETQVTTIHAAKEAACFPKNKKGPYTLKEHVPTFKPPSKTTIEIERVMVTRDAEITTMQRSYWSSYCYQGSSLDPNTGCKDGVTQVLPGYLETDKWISKQQCTVGPDCKDCYGSDSDACIRPEERVRKWVTKKEMERHENNNHFAFHTCNLSWRCSIQKSDFPTFMARRDGEWLMYTEYANGTELVLSGRDYWIMPDIVMRKTRNPEYTIEKISMSCFHHKHEDTATKELSCYDEQFGNFIEFKNAVMCTGRFCYRLLDKPRSNTQDTVNLKAASLEDLHRAIQTEHLINEELRYNFGQVLQLIRRQQKIIESIILSVGKIDDQLIGRILGNKAQSSFVGDKQFFMIPCNEPVSSSISNCNSNMIFKNGRWNQFTKPSNKPTECKTFPEPMELTLLEPEKMWLPDEIDGDDIGVVTDFEGWTLYAKEREELARAMEYSSNAQNTTSMADMMAYPKGALNATLFGFLTTHVLTIGAVALVLYVLKTRASCSRTTHPDSGLKVNMVNHISHPETMKIDVPSSMDPRRPMFMSTEQRVESPAGETEADTLLKERVIKGTMGQHNRTNSNIHPSCSAIYFE